MNYQVYPPSPELQPFIKCFWTLEDEAIDPVRQRVIPDGCMEMIVHYGDLYRQYFEDGSFVTQPRSFIFGQITSFLEIAPTGVSGIVATRFQPDGLVPFLNNIPVSSLENKAMPLPDLFGEKGKLLEQEVIAAEDNYSRIKLIQDFLLSRLGDPGTIDAVTKACVETILHSQGQLAMMKVADKININARNMQRKFVTAVGVSPKQLSKIVRLQATLKILEQKKFSSLTSLAHDNGYYDQAHFIKDFKEFTGISPKLFFAGNLELSALFIAAE